MYARFAVSEAEAMSPGGGARICCLSHRVASQDTQIGESFVPFSALTSGKDYTETLVRTKSGGAFGDFNVCKINVPVGEWVTVNG